MKMEKVKLLLELIDTAAVITCNDSPYLHSVQSSEVTGDPDNQVLRINWHDDESLEYAVIFTEGGLDQAEIKGEAMHLPDHEGEPSEIRLYALKPVNISDLASNTR
jgi:hypothetical protein